MADRFDEILSDPSMDLQRMFDEDEVRKIAAGDTHEGRMKAAADKRADEALGRIRGQLDEEEFLTAASTKGMMSTRHKKDLGLTESELGTNLTEEAFFPSEKKAGKPARTYSDDRTLGGVAEEQAEKDPLTAELANEHREEAERLDKLIQTRLKALDAPAADKEASSNEMEAAKKLYLDTAKGVQTKQMLETIAEAVGKYAAARIGAREKVAIQPDYDKTDFSTEMKVAKEELGLSIDKIERAKREEKDAKKLERENRLLEIGELGKQRQLARRRELQDETRQHELQKARETGKAKEDAETTKDQKAIETQKNRARTSIKQALGRSDKKGAENQFTVITTNLDELARLDGLSQEGIEELRGFENEVRNKGFIWKNPDENSGRELVEKYRQIKNREIAEGKIAAPSSVAPVQSVASAPTGLPPKGPGTPDSYVPVKDRSTGKPAGWADPNAIPENYEAM